MALNQQKVEELLGLFKQQYPNWKSFSNPVDLDFQKNEIDYKQRLITKAKSQLAEPELHQLIDTVDHDELISRLQHIGQDKDNNLLFLRYSNSSDLSILKHPRLDKRRFGRGIYELLYGKGASENRLNSYLDVVKSCNLPNKWTFPTFFLFLCHPDTEIFVKPTAIRTFFRFIEEESKLTSIPSVDAYKFIKDIAHQLKDALQQYEPRDMVDIQSFIWTCALVLNKQVRHWKIAPGEEAWQWEECQADGFIAIGWNELGDISGLSRKDFETRRDDLIEQHPEWKWSKNGVNQVWTFSQIKAGDRIVANQGTREVVGIGTVTGSYYYDVNASEYKHRLPVQWDDTTTRSVNEPGWVRTLIALDAVKFSELCGDSQKTMNESGAGIPPINSIYTLLQCAQETHFNTEQLDTWLTAIDRKKQAVLYGPPGTGKTFVAQKLAKHLISEGDGFIDMVQFHPAYTYEDFIQGIRPKRVEGGLDYPIVPGRFLEFCKQARQCHDPCVLIIDEINRANLSQVFGELMYLMEYREAKIHLASGETFSIPANVRIIGTMNTADRSIALVDHALRRRFAFLYLPPNYEGLRKFHQSTHYSVDSLIRLLNQINAQIGDRHYEIGTSFFLHHDLEIQLQSIWQLEIEPYLEEFFFDQLDIVKSFKWEIVKSQLIQ